ncbi:MAG: hypothetical protein M3Z23_00090, partial [Acidobacteriota bacterium]|nr:hypothetical protein [Acidobacteriota bacterium]
ARRKNQKQNAAVSVVLISAAITVGCREVIDMKIGTRSVLFGAHQFLLHPVFLAIAWRRLYGFPWDPRLWAAFFLA